MSKKLKINFVLPPAKNISGGPLAILEYAERLRARGHDVSMTTYADAFWEGDNPYPWFKFSGPIYYKKLRFPGLRQSFAKKVGGVSFELAKRLITSTDGSKELKDFFAFAVAGLFSDHRILNRAIGDSEVASQKAIPIGGSQFLKDLIVASSTVEAMPECDLNIATWWLTALPVLWSGKGKPVYFMQHYEEVFYPWTYQLLLHKLAARMSYELPMYKVANSSWLHQVIKEKFGQDVPFSTNGLELEVFKPAEKLSSTDGKIRIFSYSRPEEWKGFADSFAIVKKVREKHPNIEWNVFGYRNPRFPSGTDGLEYKFHEKLPFAELAKLYAQSDIALCTSWYESFPLPAIEAMASQTAVVTTGEGTEDYARHLETAMVFRSRDVESGFQHICKLIEDKAFRDKLAKAGYEEAQKFSWEAAVTKREKILMDIFDEKLTYNRFDPADSGLTDSFGLSYAAAPNDIKIENDCLISDDETGELFLIQNRRKHHVVSPDALSRYKHLPKKSLNRTDLERIPRSFPIFS